MKARTRAHAVGSFGPGAMLAVLALGLLVSSARTPTTPGSPPSSSDARIGSDPTSAGVEAGHVVLDMSSIVWDLAYDEERDVLWFAETSVGGADTLYSVDVNDETIHRYELPETDYTGVVTQVKVGPDGVVWVTEPYRLVRFDPDTAEMTSTPVPLDDADRIEATVEPGTWISAIAAIDGGVVVARNNVPRLDWYSTEMIPVRHIFIDHAYAGAWDLHAASDRIMLLTGAGRDDQLVVLAANGAVITAERIRAYGNQIILSGSSDGAATVSSDGRVQSFPESVANALAAVDPRGGVIVYRPDTGAIQRFTDGSPGRALQLPTVTLYPRGGSQGSISQPARVAALAVDRYGQVWFVQQDDASLHVATLP